MVYGLIGSTRCFYFNSFNILDSSTSTRIKRVSTLIVTYSSMM
jgi:hypothetical protein